MNNPDEDIPNIFTNIIENLINSFDVDDDDTVNSHIEIDENESNETETVNLYHESEIDNNNEDVDDNNVINDNDDVNEDVGDNNVNDNNVNDNNMNNDNEDVDDNNVNNGGVMNINTMHFQVNERILNEVVNNKYNEIMDWAYTNMMNVDEEIIKLIDDSYLKNLQYDDEPIDLIRYTIRTSFVNGVDFELKDIVSNIFSYGMLGINYVFNDNFDALNEILSSELKRILTRENIYNMIFQAIENGTIGINNQFGPMEDVKLILGQEELDKIPISSYKNIDQELKKKNENCLVCRDDLCDNDTVRILKCNHVFHTDCIDNWLTNHSYKCPCCRQEAGIHKPNL